MNTSSSCCKLFLVNVIYEGKIFINRSRWSKKLFIPEVDVKDIWTRRNNGLFHLGTFISMPARLLNLSRTTFNRENTVKHDPFPACIIFPRRRRRIEKRCRWTIVVAGRGKWNSSFSTTATSPWDPFYQRVEVLSDRSCQGFVRVELIEQDVDKSKFLTRCSGKKELERWLVARELIATVCIVSVIRQF